MADSNYHFAQRTEGMKRSVIREILKVASQPDIISFAGGLPSPDAFPIPELREAFEETLTLDGPSSLQYAATEGHSGLKGYLCDWLGKTQGMLCSPDQMILTSGSQQALDLLGKVFIDPNASVLVEDPTYLGFIQSFNPYQPKYVTVPLEDDGMNEEMLASAISTHPLRLIYTVPTFQNPSGVTMSLRKRELLLGLAAAKGVPIIEDDPYSRLRFQGKELPSLFSLSKGRGVIFVSTFSKVLSPGLRLGYLIAEKEVVSQIMNAKQAADLQTSTFVQHAVYHFCQRGHLEKQIPLITANYRLKAGIMVRAMRELFPKEVEFVEPEGGMFTWCRLPRGMRAAELFKLAIEKKVAFVEGSPFHANGGGENTFRLNFSNSSPSQIRTGIARIGEAIRHLQQGNQ